MQNHLQNHPKGHICPVLTVGWPMLSGFVVKGWKSDFCNSSRVKIDFFSKKNIPSADLPHNPHLLTNVGFKFIQSRLQQCLLMCQVISDKIRKFRTEDISVRKMCKIVPPYLSFVTSICHSLRACGLFVTSIAAMRYHLLFFLLHQLYSGNLTLADQMVHRVAWISHISWSSASQYGNFGLQQKQGTSFAYENSLGTPASLI